MLFSISCPCLYLRKSAISAGEKVSAEPQIFSERSISFLQHKQFLHSLVYRLTIFLTTVPSFIS